MLVFMVICTAIFAGVTFLLYRSRDWEWMSISMAVVTVVFGGGGIVETLIARIELTDDALIMTDLRGRRRYKIADIDTVGEAKGSPTVMRLKNGQRIKLPSVGSDLGNSIRSWLKQQ